MIVDMNRCDSSNSDGTEEEKMMNGELAVLQMVDWQGRSNNQCKLIGKGTIKVWPACSRPETYTFRDRFRVFHPGMCGGDAVKYHTKKANARSFKYTKLGRPLYLASELKRGHSYMWGQP